LFGVQGTRKATLQVNPVTHLEKILMKVILEMAKMLACLLLMLDKYQYV
jgi:hypothetical protein